MKFPSGLLLFSKNVPHRYLGTHGAGRGLAGVGVLFVILDRIGWDGTEFLSCIE